MNLTIIMPFYLNSGMLERHYENWAAWPGKFKARTKIVLVDDGSPEPAADVPRLYGLPDISIYRVTEDRPWHQHAARNLGAHVADDGWMLLTDMDHMLSEDAVRAIFRQMDKGKLDSAKVYMLDRIEADTGLPTMQNGKPKPHPNSFMLTREMFWRIGGYDEDYCGVYGTDGLFRARAFVVGKRGHLSIPLTRFSREIVADASTTTLPRKEGRFEGAKQAVAEAKAARGETGVVKTLQFEWERVV